MRQEEEHQNNEKTKKLRRDTKEKRWQTGRGKDGAERDRTVGDQVMTLLTGSSLCAVALGGG